MTLHHERTNPVACHLIAVCALLLGLIRDGKAVRLEVCE
jgi:hypothetical protein